MSAYIINSGKSTACGANGELCEEWQLWEIIIGIKEGQLATIFVIFSIFYNVVRFFLTARVEKLSNAEDRIKTTPPISGSGGYLILHKVSNFVRIGKYIMLALFVINMYSMLIKIVLLPA
ncbi:MAG: hypothetical protein GKS00_02135 [Alphaproteobacteria bacterium]|nr:hypothetical protein [Alphaproteobacteria bacterium]